MALLSGLRVWCCISCGVCPRRGSDLAFLWLWQWLWRRLAAAAPIGLLTWELSYAAGAALKRQNKTEQKTPQISKVNLHMEKGEKRWWIVNNTALRSWNLWRYPYCVEVMNSLISLRVVIFSVSTYIKTSSCREFPGGVVVRIWCFPHCGPGSVPGLGIEILHQATTCHRPKKKKSSCTPSIHTVFCFVLFCLFFCLFVFLPFSWAAPAAYGSSQARGPIGAAATGLRQRHSSAGSEPRLQPTSQLTKMLDPEPTEQGQGSNPQPHGS